MNLRAARLYGALTFVCALSVLSCKRHKGDEEILREKIDCLPVHLYVASKVAFTRAQTDPAVAQSRAALEQLLRTSRGMRARALAAEARGAETGAQTAPTVTLRASDVASLAIALLRLRGAGAEIVRSDREDSLRPMLPALMGLQGQTQPQWVREMSNHTEHALFMTMLVVLKLHPRLAVPVPPEVILYEAWKTNPERAALPGAESFLHGVRSYIFATNELCDLASQDASAIDRIVLNRANLQATLRQISGGRLNATAQQAEAFDQSARALAHGMSAVCYLQRDDRPQANEELRRFLATLTALGVPPSETGALRAYLAYENHDPAGARRALAEARVMRDMDGETREELDAVDRAIATSDEAVVRRTFSRARLAALCARVVYRQLERTGLFDELAKSEPMQAVRAYTEGVSHAVETTKLTAAAEPARAVTATRGWLQRMLRR
ncbi:MAG: hypothetical protein Q8Q09_13915 [Deltaproteobacteria bacterium]|nr:hypothetical protein [Deltaproteobacteria bacterium]